MKICIISEGAYPYISGGVSTWINQLISEIGDVEFKILSIMPSREENIKYKYNLPSNVTEVKILYLNDYKSINPIKGPKEPNLSQEDIKNAEKFFRFDKEISWENALKIISNESVFGDCIEFSKSKQFWNIILKLYSEFYSREEFNTFFWTLRSMFIPLIDIMQSKLIEADIYHTVSTGYAGLLGVLAKIKYNRPLILTEHGIYAREREEEIIKAKWVTGVYKRLWINFFYFLSTAAYKKADRIISLFERNRQIQLELGSEENRTLVIPNGVDIDRFSPSKRENNFNIGAVLRIVPIKDVKNLIRSFRLVKSHITKARLFLMGPYDENREYYEECLQLVKNLRLEEDVIFTGRVNVQEYMKKMNLLVLTSISEGQPLVMLEGMASGIPFVATDVGSCRELIEGKDDEIGPAGIVTTPVSPRETYKAIIKIMTNEDLKRKMGKNGRKRVEQYYTKNQFINKYKELYDNIG